MDYNILRLDGAQSNRDAIKSALDIGVTQPHICVIFYVKAFEASVFCVDTASLTIYPRLVWCAKIELGKLSSLGGHQRGGPRACYGLGRQLIMGAGTSQIVLANLIDKPPLITDKYWFWGNLIKTSHITVITRRGLISKYTIKKAKIIFKGIRLPVWRRAIWKIAPAPPLVFCEFFN